MLPFILAAVGGYFIGDSMNDKQVFADGGKIKSKQAFGLLTFQNLEDIFNVRLFGLDEQETEQTLDELRQEWYAMSESDRIRILNEYV